MVRFFLHVRYGRESLDDKEGLEFSSLEEAVAEARGQAGAIFSDALGRGYPHRPGRIDIADEAGHVLETVPIAASPEQQTQYGATYEPDQKARRDS